MENQSNSVIKQRSKLGQKGYDDCKWENNLITIIKTSNHQSIRLAVKWFPFSIIFTSSKNNNGK